MVDYILSILGLVEQAESALASWGVRRARAGVAGDPPELSVPCAELRAALETPR